MANALRAGAPAIGSARKYCHVAALCHNLSSNECGKGLGTGGEQGTAGEGGSVVERAP